MGSAMREQIEAAVRAYSEGDIEPLVALLDPEVDWRGVTRGHLWWRRTPS